ncbi:MULTISPECIES: HAD family hydrolase [unclassified Paenibacillus]|uniref:HAD family hydrolase n=1 Tax=unclassified Paenibacillus TaxID=185978 RepID=UPI0024064E1D|nr:MULTISPECIES: HAD family hydrolase [unclassified Paenibacillus]MDF9844144.1 putative hydrolase of the HAD superfamily [Paenibacillus sp. PastF-2]MDF9850733.1 putative hydrolase of the HAD superfamily [Paenibacillus sp. PastM-2]MDF9857304.1 putative hydrolase of the HAD superfamily [Paenibacillus sp. PastF-1]MDH6482588.1 putative hydrolase of the HAD superfamily [Paenibacillus sp. PastH-2]MDH6510015.1 putative hydrolase of the HAD superfamily [Paenibacillus sp. PastM-3]
MRIKAVLFDFFGTLVEYKTKVPIDHDVLNTALQRKTNEQEYTEICKKWEAAFEARVGEAKHTLLEFSMAEFAESFFSSTVDPTGRDYFVQQYMNSWRRHVFFDPHVLKVLPDLKHSFSLGIISNTHYSGMVEDILAEAGLSVLFSLVVTSVNTGIRKPSPVIFQHSANMLGLQPEECLFVGDHVEEDFYGSLSSGMLPLLIQKEPFNKNTVPAEQRLTTFLDLEDKILEVQRDVKAI